MSCMFEIQSKNIKITAQKCKFTRKMGKIICNIFASPFHLISEIRSKTVKFGYFKVKAMINLSRDSEGL